MANEKAFVNLDNARLDEQRAVMNIIVEDGVCPFCPEYLARYHKKPILREGEFWILTDNQWPYEHTKNHLLAITKNHVEAIDELSPEAYAELMEHFRWAIKERNITGGGIAMRFGEPEKSGGTVRHLHAQLIEPDIESPDYEPVRVKIGKSKK
ncbi:MAG: Histidine triad domain protein [Candidatus Kaiserbacteria bacterium]|nr:Histidine triad domain protein [Candidatus Kaiserbacteria bacterium]